MHAIETENRLVLMVDWLSDFTQFLAQRGCSAKTLAAYRQDIAHFGEWFEAQNGEAFEPGLLTGVDLRLYRQSALESGAAPASFNRRRATLRALADYALASGALSYDPFQGVERLAEQELPPRWLTKGEQHQLTRQLELAINGAATEAWRIQAIRDQAMIVLMLHAGLREGEVCALDVGDVQIGERKGRVTVRRGKGDKRREIPLNNEARRAVKLWLNTGAVSSGALFIGKGGGRISERSVQARVSEIRIAAKLDGDVTPHALRHTFAKNLLDSGAPLTVVSKLLGHSRLETTARYVQPGWEDFERAVEKL